MKKLIAVALVLGVLILTGFSMDHQPPTKASQNNISVANDYGNFTQYMQ